MNRVVPCVALFVILFQSLCVPSAVAEIVPTEDFEFVEETAEELQDGNEQQGLQPEITVEVGMGRITLPYSPPGLGSYENGLRFTSFRIGLHRASTPDSLFSAFFYFLKLKNSFPVSGRSYDLEAISWFDLAFEGGFEGQQSLAKNLRMRWLGAAEAAYDRIHYPRGTLALYGVPLKAGAYLQRDSSIGDRIASFGLGADYAFLVFGRTAVNHDSFPVSKSATANRVKFHPDRRVVGHGISAGLNIDFSSVQWREAQGVNFYHKHQLSFIWERKTRHAEDVAVEFDTFGKTQNRADLDLKQTAFALRWSERL